MGINEEAAYQAQLRREHDQERQRRLDAGRAEQLAVEDLARKYGKWAASLGWPCDYRRGWRTRGWYVVNTTGIDDSARHSVQHVLTVTTDGRVEAFNVSLSAARQAIIDKVRTSGEPWPYP